MNQKYAVKISLDNGKNFRFCYAKKPFKVREEFSDSVEHIYYLPFITDISPIKAQTGLDGSSSVPTIKVSIWDTDRKLSDEFEHTNYETVLVEMMTFSAEEELKGVFKGVLTDVSFSDGQLSFTVRGSDENYTNNPQDFFTYDSFQHFNTFSVSDVNLSPVWILDQDQEEEGGDWEVAGRFPYRGQVAVESVKSFALENVDDGDPLIFLTTKSNVYNVVEYQNGVLMGSHQSVFTLDSNGEGLAWVGQPNDPSHELIKYTSIDQDSNGDYRLMGIPQSGQYSIKNSHYKGVPITPYGVNDSIWVKANGYLPYREDSEEVNFMAGFIDIGEVFSRGGYDASLGLSSRYRTIYRVVVDDVREGAGDDSDIIKLVIHNNPKDPAHWAAINLPTTKASLPYHTPGSLDNFSFVEPLNLTSGASYPADSHDHAAHKVYKFFVKSDSSRFKLFSDQSIKTVDFEWIVKDMTVFFDNYTKGRDNEGVLDTDWKKGVKEVMKNRLKGVRIDMIKDYSEMMSSLYRPSDSQTPAMSSEINQELINNATGKFAVVAKSEVVFGDGVDDIHEKLYFNMPEDVAGRWTGEYLSSESPDWEEEDIDDLDEWVGNYLTYKRNYISPNSPQEERLSPGMESARTFFADKKYRVIFDPVPENSNELGNIFPIAYGNLENVPMMQVISRKKYMEDEGFTAGDDVYIYASHETGVKSEKDITIRWAVEGDGAGGDETERVGTKVFLNTAKNPFPNRVDGHTQRVDEDVVDFNTVLNFPYHRTDIFKTVDGKKVYGIQLRGGEWNPEFGARDRRYPIRNGFGNSKLFASFSGVLDDHTGLITGVPNSVIQHPLHILHHMVRSRGVYPYTIDRFDVDNINEMVSRTPDYRATVFINGEHDSNIVPETIDEICKQFGYLKFNLDGQITFKDASINEVDLLKPLSEGLNIMNAVEEESEGYKDIHTVVRVQYKRNWMGGASGGSSDKFMHEIELNPQNNEHCARASKAKGQKKEFELKAPYINSGYTARVVANKYAERLCQKRVVYSMSIRKGDIEFRPGDVVPMTYSPFDLDSEPVLILSVESEGGIAELEAVRFISH